MAIIFSHSTWNKDRGPYPVDYRRSTQNASTITALNYADTWIVWHRHRSRKGFSQLIAQPFVIEHDYRLGKRHRHRAL